MLKITGLDKLQKLLEDAQRAFKALDGQFATVKFDPDDAQSVEAAIRTMESAIDSNVAPIAVTRWWPISSLSLKKNTAPRFWSGPSKLELRF
jgi:hypothetical protein